MSWKFSEKNTSANVIKHKSSRLISKKFNINISY